ncbi:NAD-dependent succinate-semialdehyde dehydrogenase [Paracoccaceae bacterium GXU_MW_L88]
MQKRRAPELDRLKDKALMREFAYVDGEWRAAQNGATVDVTNPANGDWLGSVPQFSGTESRAAVDAAEAAFRGWDDTLPQERAEILRRWRNLMHDHREDLALIMTLEQGKPISECRGEIDYAAVFLEFYAEEAKRANIEGITSHLRNAEVELWREPCGVAALITPWNFPSAMITRKAAAALAAGCVCVVHPSKETPFSALALAELAERAGVPKGVFNVVTGQPAEVVEPWTADPRVRVLSFTGSTEIGRLLYQQSAPTIKRLIMELGGHAPFIVFDDADMDRAIDSAIAAKFATTGQDCLGANRFYVHRSVYDDFCQRFTEATEALTLAPGIEDKDLGPLMNANAVQKQKDHVADALEKGAVLLTGGEVDAQGPLFFQPTVLKDVPENASILSEETFGPVAPILPFDDEDEVIAKANATEYGLIAYFHTSDAARIYRITRALEYGMVAVNRTKVTGAPIPFGGMKQSGLGREGARQGLEAFTDIKYVCRNYDRASKNKEGRYADQ